MKSMFRGVLVSVVVLGSLLVVNAWSATSVSIAANAYPGVDSGVLIGAEQSVVVTASGSWSVGGPYGMGDANGATTMATESCALVTSAPMRALIGSLNGGVTWFLIGTGPTTVAGPGQLLLSANDCPGPGGAFFLDNSGSLLVTITPSAAAPFVITSPPGGSILSPGQAVTVQWTGGNPSWLVDVFLIESTPGIPATAVYPLGQGIPNSGEVNWTFPSSLPFEGPCGHTYRFYVQEVTQITWTYGPYFTVVCEMPPTAEAGANQSIHAGQTVQLDGNGSSDDTTPTQNLEYTWSFTSVPSGSTATLSAPHAIEPTFVADLSGTYVVSLVVTDASGLSSNPDEVTISSLNAPPNAEAGPDQGTFVGNLVPLNGSESNDPEFDPFTFSWTLIASPAGSTAALSDANTATPIFVPDLPGSYVVELIVSDPFVASAPDTVTIAVITTADFAERETVDAINTIGSLPPSSVTTTGNQTALGNLLTQVIAALQVGDVGEAKRKLQDAIERTDGCTLRGSPDPPGGGQIKQDYIKACTDQAPVYTLFKDALDALSGGL